MLSATKQLPVGTVYAVFVGIGAAGTVIVDMLFINHVISLMKLLFIILLIIGIIGLKLSTDDQSGRRSIKWRGYTFSCRMLLRF